MSFIKIYIGNQIEHESDRVILQHVYKVLSEKNLNAIIFANVHLERQIDLIVALDKVTLVIEAKSCSFPLRGEKNGVWEYLYIYGSKSCERNYYDQTLTAMHKVRDAIKKFAKTTPPYPTAVLAFTKPLHKESSICKSDGKVQIIELKDFNKLLDSELNKKKSSQDLSIWERFAKSENLTPVENVKMALDDKLQKAKQTLDLYCKNFQRYYSGCINNLILNEDLSNTLEKIKEKRVNNIILLIGPSGCGKTLITYKYAIDSLEKGNIPIVLNAKYFKEELSMIQTMIAHELGLCSVGFNDLIHSIKILDKSILFILDGYNECKENYQSNLIRSFLALCEKYSSFSIISSTKSIKVNFSITNIIEEIISYPSVSLKVSVAQQAAISKLLPFQLELLEEVAQTCFDAKMVGEVGDDLRPNISLFIVYDTYIRKQLGEFALDGIKILSAIADSLNKNISFSLSIRELQRIIEKNQLNTNILTLLFNKKFIIRNKDQVSFFHEVYLHFFTAENIVRSSSTENIVKDLSLPLHDNNTRKEFVIGAIEDINLQKVLSVIEDPLIISSCILGRCGLSAKQWGEEYLKDILEKIQIEISGIICHIDEENKFNTRPISSSNIKWNSQDHAFFIALTYLCCRGQFLEELFSAIKATDIILAAEYKRLKQEASNIKNLRSIIFDNTYTFKNFNKLGISSIVTLLQNQHFGNIESPKRTIFFDIIESPKMVKFIEEKLSDENLLPGQFFVLLSLFMRLDLQKNQIKVNLFSIFNRYWYTNFNIRLSLLNMLRRYTSFNTINKEERDKIIEILEISLRTSNDPYFIMEALEKLGALEEENNKEILNIRLNIQNILENPGDEISRKKAAIIYSCQMDHPYKMAYSQAVSELTLEDKKALLLIASSEYDINSIFAPILLSELICFRDPSIASSIVRFAALPTNRKFEFDNGYVSQFFEPDDLRRFIIAHMSLGIFNSLLPILKEDPLTKREEIIIAIGRIFYWSNRSNLSIEIKKTECFPEIQKLLTYPDISVVILSEIDHIKLFFFHEYFSSYDSSEYICNPITRYFPDLLCKICRKFLTNPLNFKSYFTDPYLTSPKFAITSLGSIGIASDIEILKLWENNRDYGTYAINGIKNLNQKNIG